VLSVYSFRIYTRIWPIRTLGLDDMAISIALVSQMSSTKIAQWILTVI
jgi:hypothetical protein